MWFNWQNAAQNKNFADAFLLRLFHGTIYKVQNPDDETLDDTPTVQTADLIAKVFGLVSGQKCNSWRRAQSLGILVFAFDI